MSDKATGNYLSAIFDYMNEKVVVWERHGDERRRVLYAAPYYFYMEDPDGKYIGLNKKKLSRFDFDNGRDFDAAVAKYKHLPKYESDIAPLDKVLMNEYYGRELPQINVSFLDIEVDYKSDQGFSSPENPYAPVNAITIYHQWSKKFVTLAVPPPEWDGTWKRSAHPGFDFDQVIICETEAELLRRTLRAIEDSDILSGWNSEFFDLPYLIKRTEITLGKSAAQKWCFDYAKNYQYKEVERFGSPHIVVRLSGRVHLDYMDLFKKFNLEGRPSYSLGAITHAELDEPKMEYEGTLEQLYHNDFSHFVRYNVRDVENLRDLDKKFKYIRMASKLARENTVPLEAVLGTVKYVETGIANFAHHIMNVIVHDKHVEEKHDKVEGAIVLSPKIGKHDWIGSVDIKSLYPSTIRSLNISPETMIGQFTNFEFDWRGIRAKDQMTHTLRFEETDECVTATGEEWWHILREKKWAVSGYGTVFDQGNGKGIVPAILEYWYNERVRMQAEKKKWSKIALSLENDESRKEEYLEALRQAEDFDIAQGTKKVQLNSTYGALLNLFFRFGRVEMGASVTGSGRQITTHMLQTIGEILTGKLDPLVKRTEIDEKGITQHIYTSPNEAIIYSDTDSGYFLTFAKDIENAVAIADDVADGVNASFPGFMREAFNCQPEFDNLISAGREVVGERALFQAKKKYVIKVVDNEGVRKVKLKSQGSELKKSDTPKIIQEFLGEVLNAILDGADFAALEEIVNKSRGTVITQENLLQLGVSRSVNELDQAYSDYLMLEKTGRGRAKMGGGQRAAINWNEHAVKREGPGALQIKSGDKVMTFSLKKNEAGFKTIAVPADMTKLPDWFLEDFEVDMAETEKKLFDAKLKSIFAACGWDIPTVQGSHFNSLFDF